MHVLKDRHLKILNYLLGKKVPVLIQHIAETMGVSRRTVRYDLKEIDYWLEKQTIKLMRVPKKGVWIADVDRAKKLLKSELPKEMVISYRILSQEERRSELLGLLFGADDRLAVGVMAEAIGVSKSTCYKDLDMVEAWLQKRHITLEHIQHKGYRLKASEYHWRKGLIDYLEENMGNKQLMNLLAVNNQEKRGETRLAFMQQPKYQSLFSELDFKRMLVFVEAIEHKLGMVLIDSAYAGLMIHIAIAVKRLREGETIEMGQEQLDEVRGFPEYKLIEKVLGTMNFHRLVTIPEAEIGYITAHVLAAKFRSQGDVLTSDVSTGNIRHAKSRDIESLIITLYEIIIRTCSIEDESTLRADLRKALSNM